MAWARTNNATHPFCSVCGSRSSQVAAEISAPPGGEQNLQEEKEARDFHGEQAQLLAAQEKTANAGVIFASDVLFHASAWSHAALPEAESPWRVGLSKGSGNNLPSNQSSYHHWHSNAGSSSRSCSSSQAARTVASRKQVRRELDAQVELQKVLREAMQLVRHGELSKASQALLAEKLAQGTHSKFENHLRGLSSHPAEEGRWPYFATDSPKPQSSNMAMDVDLASHSKARSHGPRPVGAGVCTSVYASPLSMYASPMSKSSKQRRHRSASPRQRNAASSASPKRNPSRSRPASPRTPRKVGNGSEKALTEVLQALQTHVQLLQVLRMSSMHRWLVEDPNSSVCDVWKLQ
eukprot:gnl/MRDRNA2_/MRDRNA2_58187_c0_seq1.p1 gnl/MRDRNA2_/MRDRNA2_58187_c0~~gnl/MRDRNA2_/MRDRNA2_58187_c0_seq1.p1  ORF type:complete len:350 (-),score=58.65 gnl/MRDRNA2_/MRDRNA2_58187_c0_seq1:42-1091(-)